MKKKKNGMKGMVFNIVYGGVVEKLLLLTIKTGLLVSQSHDTPSRVFYVE